MKKYVKIAVAVIKCLKVNFIEQIKQKKIFECEAK